MSAARDQARKGMPAGWLPVALIGWGLLADNLPGAVVMAILLLGVAVSPVKWNIALKDFHRAADLTSVIFGVVTILQFQRYSVHGIYEILRAAPYCFFPLILAQQAATAQRLPLSALVYGLRRHPEGDRELDVAPHYLLLCIIASSTTNQAGVAFALFSAVLLAGVLLAARPRRYARWQAGAVLAVAVAFALATHAGILIAQRSLESSFAYWINQLPWTLNNANTAFTSIGSIGRLKLSDRIRARIEPGPGVNIPITLQEASYDTFKYGTWKAEEAEFEALDQRADRRSWVVAGAEGANEATMEITFQHSRELTLLPLPRGARLVQSDEIAELQSNRFGTIMAESPPGALRYYATPANPIGIEPPPTPRDLEVPPEYSGVIADVDREIGGQNLSLQARAARIEAFFHDKFTYTLIQRGGFSRRTALSHFLRETRRGHCEYFATASVLLLRQAGIPARYAVGYMVENYSEIEDAYIARARHAHAWAIAYIDGSWQVVDSTPGVWYDLEEASASGWQTINDLASWFWYRFQRLSQADLSEAGDILLWLVPPLALVLYLRLRRSPTAVRTGRTGTGKTTAKRPAPLDDILQILAGRGLEPEPGETIARFLQRAAPREANGVALTDLVRVYYQWRYSPHARVTDAALESQINRYGSGL